MTTKKKHRSPTPGTGLSADPIDVETLPKGHRRGIDWDAMSELGVVPDTILAEQLGCTPQNVARARHCRGIPACAVQTMRFDVLAARWKIARAYTECLRSDEGGAL